MDDLMEDAVTDLKAERDRLESAVRYWLERCGEYSAENKALDEELNACRIEMAKARQKKQEAQASRDIETVLRLELDVENDRLREAVRALIAAMCDQLKREKGLFHIPAHTMRYMWAQAIRKGRKALEHKERRDGSPL